MILSTSARQRLYRYKAHHVLLWLLYYAFFFMLYDQYYASSEMLLLVITVYFVFNATAFYTTIYYLFPRFLYRSRYVSFFGLFFLLIVVLAVGLTVCLASLFRELSPEFANNTFAIFQFAFLSIGTMAGLMAGLKLIMDKIKHDRLNRALDKQRLETELQYLKAQVNPHFLFNAINSVYFLIKKDPDHAAKTLIKLSDLLRFQLYDCASDRIPIEKELSYLMNYVDLEKLRKGNRIEVSVSCQGELSGFDIAPFLLIPFFENAFKFVSASTDKLNKIDITLQREDDKFKAVIHNTKENHPQNVVGGIGLKNVRRRLELLYPDAHELTINDNADTYTVRLILPVL